MRECIEVPVGIWGLLELSYHSLQSSNLNGLKQRILDDKKIDWPSFAEKSFFEFIGQFETLEAIRTCLDAEAEKQGGWRQLQEYSDASEAHGKY